MREIVSCLEELRLKLDGLRKEGLKEIPTRTIFIDPLLKALGWNLVDPDEVELEHPTVDGKSVDYALKINRKPVIFIEAKPLNDPLNDVKAITQVVGYAANAGVEWCILTNGATYKVFKSTERAEAPDKLLFEVSIDPKESEDTSQIAKQLNRFSREATAQGVLDEIGQRVFVTGKVRKALDKLFSDPPKGLVKIIRSSIGDKSLTSAQIRESLKVLWSPSFDLPITSNLPETIEKGKPKTEVKRGRDYGEEFHLQGKPREVVELYRIIDRYCRELDPSSVRRKHLAKYIAYSSGKNIFCSVRIQKSGLRIWLKLAYSQLESPPDFVRDVSRVGHWGSGDVEVRVDNIEKLQASKALIKESFERNKKGD